MLFVRSSETNRLIEIVLTEQERYSLASQEAIDFVKRRMKNIDRYSDTSIDFFSDKEVKEEDIDSCPWNFIVGYNGKNYSCIYDNNNFPDDKLGLEARLLLMWRVDVLGGYIEVIGEYYDDNGDIITVENTDYDDISCYVAWQGKIIERVELNDSNKDMVRNFILN